MHQPPHRPSRVDEQQLRRSIGRVRRRIRLQRAWDAATMLAIAALGAAGLAVALMKTGALPVASYHGWLWVALSLPLVGAFLGAARPVSLLKAARLVDASHGLHGRMGNALAFARVPRAHRTAFMQAAVDDAARRLREIDPARALPWRRPPASLAVAGLAVAVLALRLVEVPRRQPAAAPPRLHARLLHPDDIEAFARDTEALRDSSELPEPIRETAQELNTLLEALADRKLSPEEAMRRIRALERKLDELPGAAETLDDALRELAARTDDARITERLEQALQEADAAAAAKELRELADKIDHDAIDRQELERLRRAMKKMAEEDREARAKLKRELERQRSLLRRQEKQAQTPRQRRLLQRKRRQLERLQREQSRSQQRRRQLQRLRRDLDRAAQSLQREQRSQASRDMKRGAEDLQRMARQQQSRRKQQRLSRRLSELRELIRRSGGDQGGQSGQGKGEREQDQRMDRFVRLAKGDRDREPGDQKGAGAEPGGKGEQDGKKKKKRMHVLQPGEDGKGQKLLRMGQQSAGTRQAPGSGEAAGDGPGAPPLSDPTQIDSTRVDTRVQGRAREGPTRSHVIQGASRDGFVSQGYRRVYADYENHAERVLERDQVPDGYRFYVRRYFQLIRPREDSP